MNVQSPRVGTSVWEAQVVTRLRAGDASCRTSDVAPAGASGFTRRSTARIAPSPAGIEGGQAKLYTTPALTELSVDPCVKICAPCPLVPSSVMLWKSKTAGSKVRWMEYPLISIWLVSLTVKVTGVPWEPSTSPSR